ncbi:MAG: YceD family protein [Gammaproteobacteria bacterium]|nr:YceD family protein [Gammaproteobacteria bacterium]
MSTALPQRFDPWRLAAQDVHAAGEIDTRRMPRLTEALASDKPIPVDVELRIFSDSGGRARITGTVEATLPLTCQRCLDPVEVPVYGEFSLVVVATPEESDGVPEDAEPLILEKGPQVSVHEMVEDELILALPVIARHENIEDCGPRGRILADVQAEAAVADDKEEEISEEPEERKENPFEVLKKLKTDHSD